MGLCAEALAVLRQVAESVSHSDSDVCVEGTNYILRQPEFKDASKMDSVLELLEQRKELYQLLSRAILGPNVMIMIGTENPFREMHNTSFVAARYKIAGRVAGTIGVLGPTRMDYGRAVAAVEVMARNLGDLLTLLSLI
jgi:heat-inducible transcriptional repressor